LDFLFGAVLAFLIPFLAARILISVIKYLMNKTTALTMANRILGGAWGAVKGIVIAGIFLTILNVLPAKGSLQQALNESTTYSIYKAFPFPSLWDKFKLPKEVKINI